MHPLNMYNISIALVGISENVCPCLSASEETHLCLTWEIAMGLCLKLPRLERHPLRKRWLLLLLDRSKCENISEDGQFVSLSFPSSGPRYSVSHSTFRDWNTPTAHSSIFFFSQTSLCCSFFLIPNGCQNIHHSAASL